MYQNEAFFFLALIFIFPFDEFFWGKKLLKYGLGGITVEKMLGMGWG
jgi:hypothetical protein